MKLKSTADGLSARPVNPFEQYGDAMATEFMEFEATNPALDLTTPMPGNTVFEGVEVWQYEPQDEDFLQWYDCDEAFYNAINRGNEKHKHELPTIPTRKCYHPLDVKEQVREEAPKCKECNCAYDSDEHLVKCNRRDKTAPFNIKPLPVKASNPELGVDYNTICQQELDKFNSEYKEIFAERNLPIEDLTNVYFRQGFVSATQQQGLVSSDDLISNDIYNKIEQRFAGGEYTLRDVILRAYEMGRFKQRQYQNK